MFIVEWPPYVKESAKRLDLGKKKLKEMGGEIQAFYLTTGSYDMLAVVDVPNDATLAKHRLWLGSQGNLRTQTVKDALSAFSSPLSRNKISSEVSFEQGT